MDNNKREMKKIDLATLDSVERKASARIVKRLLGAFAVVAVVAACGWGAHKILDNEMPTSRLVVNNLTCSGCVTRVNNACKIPGVIESSVSLARNEAVVKFDKKKTTPEEIKKAISKAGYPVRTDGVFKQSGKGVDGKVVATVNGKPVFQKDVERFVHPEDGKSAPNTASGFFDFVGAEILLKIADEKGVFARSYEIEDELILLGKKQGLSVEQLTKKAAANIGSMEKYNQIVAQRIGIRKLIDEHVAGIQDTDERNRKALDWLAGVFRSSDVKIIDGDLKDELAASAGKDEWNEFWPRMISRDTGLKRIIIR